MNPVLALIAGGALIVAAIMTVVAWRIRRDERRRAAARAAVLAAAIHSVSQREFDVRPVATAPSFAPLAAIAVLCVAAVTGLVLMAESGSRSARQTGGAAAVSRAAHTTLELSALEHDRDNGRLIVRGIVRNPSSAGAIQGLVAVVQVFSKDGGPIASGRAPVANPVLSPGAEAPFVVEVPESEGVDRYRVSFRTGDSIVPHTDRRGRSAQSE